MDLNTILRVLVSISCGSLMIRVLISRRHWGWLGVALSILSIMGLCFWLVPDRAGLIGGIFWFVFVLLPILGLRQVNHFIEQEKFRQAQHLAFYLAWLHPADGWQKQPKFLRALALTQQGEIEKANAILNQDLKASRYGFQDTAQAMQFRLEARWQECLNWLQTEVAYEKIWRNSTLATVYLRTLGEVGDVNGLIWALKSHQQQLSHLGSAMTVHLARLYAFAFAGEVKQVQTLFASDLKVYSPAIKNFWVATAEMAAGNPETGSQILMGIQDKDLTLEAAIAARINEPCPEAQLTLTAESIRILAALQKRQQEERNYGGAIRLTPTQANLTYSLILVKILVFIWEIQAGGAQNLQTLYLLGAAVPNAIISGEPWRIFTANFLHYGSIHLGSNLLGLWILGPYVESYLGWIRYLIVYLLSGMAAISVFAGVTLQTGQGDEILVGASAAIMGLMGATFMILWRGWRQDNSAIAQERLRVVMVIIGLQVIFDLSVANVSFLGHFFGLIFGILLTWLLLSGRKKERSS